jgi:multisubunit Na+/H+ antiporter MnhB subunit
LLVGVATCTSLLLGHPGPGGILLGGAAIGLSVLLFAVGFGPLVRRRPRLAIGVLFVKLLGLVGLGWLAFTSRTVLRPDPIGFALGLTCFPVAAVWEAVRTR